MSSFTWIGLRACQSPSCSSSDHFTDAYPLSPGSKDPPGPVLQFQQSGSLCPHLLPLQTPVHQCNKHVICRLKAGPYGEKLWSGKLRGIFTNIHEPEANNCFSIITQVIMEISKQRSVKFYHSCC